MKYRDPLALPDTPYLTVGKYEGAEYTWTLDWDRTAVQPRALRFHLKKRTREGDRPAGGKKSWWRLFYATTHETPVYTGKDWLSLEKNPSKIPVEDKHGVVTKVPVAEAVARWMREGPYRLVHDAEFLCESGGFSVLWYPKYQRGANWVNLVLPFRIGGKEPPTPHWPSRNNFYCAWSRTEKRFAGKDPRWDPIILVAEKFPRVGEDVDFIIEDSGIDFSEYES